MNIDRQVKIAYVMGTVAIVFLLLTGMMLPMVISSEAPLSVIVIAVVFTVVSFPVCIYLCVKLFLLKREVKKTKLKGKRHEKSETQSKSKRLNRLDSVASD